MLFWERRGIVGMKELVSFDVVLVAPRVIIWVDSLVFPYVLHLVTMR